MSLNINLVSKSVLFWSALLVCYPEANLKSHSVPSHSSVLKAFAILILVGFIHRSLAVVAWSSYTNGKNLLLQLPLLCTPPPALKL